MTRARRQGYTILMVLAILAMVGASLVVLADMTDSLSLESQKAYAAACKRNLTASGLAWLAHNRQQFSREDLAKGVDLDVKSLRQGQLRVGLLEGGQCRITTECRSGRLVVKGSEVFSVGAEAP